MHDCVKPVDRLFYLLPVIATVLLAFYDTIFFLSCLPVIAATALGVILLLEKGLSARNARRTAGIVLTVCLMLHVICSIAVLWRLRDEPGGRYWFNLICTPLWMTGLSFAINYISFFKLKNNSLFAWGRWLISLALCWLMQLVLLYTHLDSDTVASRCAVVLLTLCSLGFAVFCVCRYPAGKERGKGRDGKTEGNMRRMGEAQ